MGKLKEMNTYAVGNISKESFIGNILWFLVSREYSQIREYSRSPLMDLVYGGVEVLLNIKKV